VNEKLNIKRRIRYRRNRNKGINQEGDLESATSTNDSGEVGRSNEVARAEEEDEEEVPQMSITATVVCFSA